MDNEGIARQATCLVRGIHPAEELVLVSTETTDGIISFRFHKRFSLDGIVLVQAFGVTFTASGRFINIATKSQAEIEEVPANTVLKPATPEDRTITALGRSVPGRRGK